MLTTSCSCAMAMGTRNAATVKYMAVVNVVVVGKRRDGARYEKVEGAEAPAGAGEVEGIAPRLFRNQCFGQTRRGGRLAD
jgi:hypothetical protein